MRPSHVSFGHTRGLSAGALAAAVVTAFVLALDMVFRPALPAGYVAFFTAPLWPRIAFICALAAIEEVKFRLLLTTGLAWLLSRWRYAMIAAIALAQLTSAWPAIIADPVYALLRYWLVGCTWGWLYWRHGFVTALIAHASVHLVLDPLLYIVLSPQ